MPMAPLVAAAVVAGGAGLAGAGISAIGANNAANKQKQEADAALQFAKEQAATQQQNYEQQQSALKAQWDAKQAQEAPYRAAAASIFAKYGIGVPASPAQPTSFTPGMVSGGGTAGPSLGNVGSFSAIPATQSQTQNAMGSIPGLTLADLGFAGNGQLISQ
jgi:hypothetical protein